MATVVEFKVVNRDGNNKFVVMDNKGGTLNVTGEQIMTVISTGNGIGINVVLDMKGFTIILDNGGTVYVPVKVTGKLRSLVKKYVETAKQPIIPVMQNHAVQQVQHVQDPVQASVPVQASARVRKVAKSTGKTDRIVGGNRMAITFRGDRFISAEQICARFGCADIARFKELYNAGYPVDICLGLRPVDDTIKNKPRQQQIDDFVADVPSNMSKLYIGYGEAKQ